MLRGPVEELRARAGHRYAEVEFTTADGVWTPGLAETTVVERTGSRVRVKTRPTVDPAALLAEASAHGKVRSFSFAPPDLSEVFLDTVGRSSTGNGRPSV